MIITSNLEIGTTSSTLQSENVNVIKVEPLKIKNKDTKKKNGWYNSFKNKKERRWC